jgi:hypothetical protein
MPDGHLVAKVLAAGGNLPAGDRAVIVISVFPVAVVIYQTSLMIVQVTCSSPGCVS